MLGWLMWSQTCLSDQGGMWTWARQGKRVWLLNFGLFVLLSLEFAGCYSMIRSLCRGLIGKIGKTETAFKVLIRWTLSYSLLHDVPFSPLLERPTFLLFFSTPSSPLWDWFVGVSSLEIEFEGSFTRRCKIFQPNSCKVHSFHVIPSIYDVPCKYAYVWYYIMIFLFNLDVK